MRIRATVELAGKTATGITVPADVVAAPGPSKRTAVRVAINGYIYRTTIAPMGGQFRIPVSAEVRGKPPSRPATWSTSTSSWTPNLAS